MKAFILFLAVLATLLGNSYAVLPATAVEAVSRVTLTWTEDPRTTQTITWQRGEASNACLLEWTEGDGIRLARGLGTQVIAGEKTVSTGVGDTPFCQVTLQNLKPGVRYYYRIGDGHIWSATESFLTAPSKEKAFQFLIFGDSQSVDYRVWHTTVQQAWQRNPKAAFFVNMGDLVDNGQDEGQWSAWFHAAADVIKRIPAMPVSGNHENYTLGGGFALPGLFTAHFPLPANGPEELKGRVYSYDYGPVHFVVLDSQAGEQSRFIPDMLKRQKEWLEADLAATMQPWKVVFIHRPLYGNRQDDSGSVLRRTFEDVLLAGKVDVVFSAHEHVYARTGYLPENSNGERKQTGIRYVATGRSGSKTYQNVMQREWNEYFYNPLEEPNYLVAEVSTNRLLLKAYRQSGSLIDSWSIEK